MADYIYLLQNRLSSAQQTALQTIRDVAKAHALTVFLVGGAVRDLTSGSPVHDLDVAVQGNALNLKREMELAGATISGEVTGWQAFFALFPGGVRVEIGSTLSITYPKPGKPVTQPATILDDLRRRDFTANAMALSLNEGSYGLLMDPLNGVADIENRQLRLVSNYGFIEDPVRMVRAARFSARLGWTMDEKTQTRYETGKSEKYIAALSSTHRGYETEEIFHEEDPLRVLRRLEDEGWMKHLFPAMTTAKANDAELGHLREVQTQLQVSGINPDPAAANFPLLTAKLSSSELTELKKSFVRQGFVHEVESLEAEAKQFATQLAGKAAALPSQAWALIHGAKPEAVLWAAYSSKNPTVQAKLKSFHTEWPKARQKVPFPLMQEMRIVPELDRFNEAVEKIFFELMDGNLATPEEQKAFLEPFSPPAPPPPLRLGRSRASKKESKSAKGKKKLAEVVDDEDDDLDVDLRADDEEREEATVPLDLEDEEPSGASILEEDQLTELAISPPDDEIEAEIGAEIDSEDVPSGPVVAQPQSVAVTPKPKRSRPKLAKAETEVEASLSATPAATVPPPAPDSEAAPAEQVAPLTEPVQTDPEAASPAEASKTTVVTAKAVAKKTVLSQVSKTTRKAEPVSAPAKKAAAKQVSALPEEAAAITKGTSRTAPVPATKTAGKTAVKTSGDKER